MDSRYGECTPCAIKWRNDSSRSFSGNANKKDEFDTKTPLVRLKRGLGRQGRRHYDLVLKRTLPPGIDLPTGHDGMTGSRVTEIFSGGIFALFEGSLRCDR